MFAPTLGTLAAWRWADRDALRISGVRRRGPWRWYLAAYLLVPARLLLGAALAVLVGLQQPDPTFGVLQELIRQQAAQSGVDPPPIPISQIATIGALRRRAHRPHRPRPNPPPRPRPPPLRPLAPATCLGSGISS
jgi:hypothetical protein